MRRTGRTIAAAAVVLLATGCAPGGAVSLGGPAGSGSGSSPGSGSGSGSGGRVKTLADAGGGAAGPATITRARAEALARALLGRALLPRGARAFTGRPPAALAQPGSVELGQPSAALHRLWTAAGPMASLYRFWSGRVPAAMAWSGSGQGSDHGTLTQESVSYVPKHLPAGVRAASLTMSVAPAGAGRPGSVIRADVQVIWYPPRSTAEYIPAGTRAVTITASAFSPRPHSVTRTFTSRSVVRRLAAMLNGAYALPRGSVLSCPLELASYRLAFAKSPGATPFLVATDTTCPGIQITVAGHSQPELEATAALAKLVQGLVPIAISGSPVHSPVHPRPGLRF